VKGKREKQAGWPVRVLADDSQQFRVKMYCLKNKLKIGLFVAAAIEAALNKKEGKTA
jgi:hypothetical protein